MVMTRFDINRVQRSPEEWSAIAFEQTTENNIQWTVIGGLTLGIVAAAATNPITGVLIGAWSIFSSIGKAQEVARNQKAIREHGCVAHVLEEDDFRAYLQQVGKENVQQELSFAQDQGYAFSNAALNYLDVVPLPQLTAPSANSWTEPQSTLLPQTVITHSQTHETSYTIDIVREIASPIRNCIIFGIGGSGKGMLVSNALRRIKAENPNRKIFYIDPKNEPGEYGYTEGVVDIVHRKTCDGRSPEEICAWMDEVLDKYTEWANQQEESLLVIDEGTILGKAAKACKNTRIGTLILHTASLGGAKRKNVWLMAQAPFVGSLGLDLTDSSQIAAVAIVSSTNTNVIKQWARSPILEKITQEQLTELIKHSPVNRAVFFGGNSKWGAMPELPNYSAIDRDGNKPTGDALPTEQRQELRERTQPNQTQILIQKLKASSAKTVEEFISEIGCSDRLDEMRQAIASTIKGTDLEARFFPKL